MKLIKTKTFRLAVITKEDKNSKKLANQLKECLNLGQFYDYTRI